MSEDLVALTVVRPDSREWDQFVRSQARAHLLQLAAWGALKSDFGWDAQIVALSDENGIVAGASVLLKRLPLGSGKMAYLPRGPYVTDQGHYPLLWEAIRSQTGAAFLKVEAGHFRERPRPDFFAMGFVPSPQSIQPDNTIQVDISDDNEFILKRMNQGTRRKIRKSLKASINYIEGSRTDLDDFDRLMQMTGERNDFGVHSAEYYERVFDLFVPENGTLLIARHDDKPLGAIMIFAVGSTAWYFYGASSRENSKLYASYGLQWQAIQWAKARGCVCYDLWGIPDHDHETLEAQFKDRSDGLWGVYGFKRGWGGEVRRSAGSWDLVFNPLVYGAYRTALKLRG